MSAEFRRQLGIASGTDAGASPTKGRTVGGWCGPPGANKWDQEWFYIRLEDHQDIPWHQDAGYWWRNLREVKNGGFEDAEALERFAASTATVWIPLVDVDDSLGPMVYEPGSHARPPQPTPFLHHGRRLT